MKVYVLIVDSTDYYSTDKAVRVFANHKDAEEVFNEEVKRAIADARTYWVTEESDMSFSTYEDGDYLNNHINVSVLEKEVILEWNK